jgi:DNA-binding protein
MDMKTLLEKVLQKEITYDEACSELKKLKLDEDTNNKYERMFYKQLGNEAKVNHMPLFQFPGIPNEFYFPILQDAINQVREEKYSPEIAQNLYNNYCLSPALLNYFLNESINIVKMNTLNEEEINAIGKAYVRAINIANKTRRNFPPDPDDIKKIKAEPVSEVNFIESDE